MEEKSWHAEEVDTVLKSLESSRSGISEEEAQKRLKQYGSNELIEKHKITPLQILLDQFKSILVIILIISAAVSAYLAWEHGESFTDTYDILFNVDMKANLEFVQE